MSRSRARGLPSDFPVASMQCRATEAQFCNKILATCVLKALCICSPSYSWAFKPLLSSLAVESGHCSKMTGLPFKQICRDTGSVSFPKEQSIQHLGTSRHSPQLSSHRKSTIAFSVSIHSFEQIEISQVSGRRGALCDFLVVVDHPSPLPFQVHHVVPCIPKGRS